MIGTRRSQWTSLTYNIVRLSLLLTERINAVVLVYFNIESLATIYSGHINPVTTKRSRHDCSSICYSSGGGMWLVEVKQVITLLVVYFSI